MNDLIDRLQELTLKQQERINELQRDNRRLKTLTHTLGNRVYELEDKQRVIDSACIDIPIGIDINPKDFNR
jgi:small-conductance mechanosensitive channel